MKITHTTDNIFYALFGSIKKAIANFLDIKRLNAGCDFQESDSAMAPLVGKRGYNMGDLWREPPNSICFDECAKSQPEHFNTEHSETASSNIRP